MCEGRRLLAVHHGFGHIAECGCGTIHLTVGPVSYALDREALQRMHVLVGTAIKQLEPAAEDLAQFKPFLMDRSHFH